MNIQELLIVRDFFVSAFFGSTFIILVGTEMGFSLLSFFISYLIYLVAWFFTNNFLELEGDDCRMNEVRVVLMSVVIMLFILYIKYQP